jgi:hypothetical protein
MLNSRGASGTDGPAQGQARKNKIYGIRTEKPEVDFATTARSFGIWSKSPVTEPGEVAKALREALKVVKGGKPPWWTPSAPCARKRLASGVASPTSRIRRSVKKYRSHKWLD